MSDPNTYINTYIDHAMGLIHEQLTTNLQLKTNLKIATDLVSQKNEVIASLENRINNTSTVSNELNRSKEDYNKLEQECVALRNKVSHMDTLVNQFNNLKNELTKKIQECDNLKNEVNILNEKIEELSKNQLLDKNVKEKKPKLNNEKPKETDDF